MHTIVLTCSILCALFTMLTLMMLHMLDKGFAKTQMSITFPASDSSQLS